MESSAGFRRVELIDEYTGMDIPMAVFYPARADEREERVGNYDLRVALDAAPSEGSFPLALISHGSGVSPLVHRTLARHLARNGFIVGLPEHPYNNDSDNRLQGTLENLVFRPRHLRAALDWFGGEAFGALLRSGSVSVIGHSLGGYTALALAGGRPMTFPHETADHMQKRIHFEPDRRVKALVLLGPATAWFMGARALAEVAPPILMLLAEKDDITPHAVHGRIVAEGVADPSRVAQRVVQGAGHFSFLSPFPDEMSGPGFALSQDPEGFDRAAFHDRMNAEVLAFLARESG